MHVLDVTHAFADASGGIRTYMEAKRRYLTESLGWRHTMIVPGKRDQRYNSGRTVTWTLASPRIPRTHYRLFTRLEALRRTFAHEGPDLIELGSGYMLPSAAFAYRRVTGTPVIAFYHTDYPEAYVRPVVARMFGMRAGRKLRGIVARQARTVLRKSDLTVTASLHLARKLRAIGVDNLEYVPLGVDTTVFHPRRAGPALRRCFEAGAIVCVYAGRLDDEKRIRVLLDAFDCLPDRTPCRLIVVGDGPLQPLVAARRLGGRVHWLPFERSREGLATILASSDVYVSAAPFETFGLSVLEAQASGLPVVGVRSGAMTERVSEAVGTLARPDDAQDLARCIAGVAANGRVDMGRAARAMVERSYGWPRTFERLADLYRMVCGRV